MEGLGALISVRLAKSMLGIIPVGMLLLPGKAQPGPEHPRPDPASVLQMRCLSPKIGSGGILGGSWRMGVPRLSSHL